jgi:DNA-binding IclR family transcriptional regulator
MVDAPNGSLKQTTLNSLTIVETLAELESATFATVAEEVGLAKSTTYAHLETLRTAGYVVKEGERYRLSLEFLHVGGSLISTKPYYTLIEQKVRELAQTTGERTQFIVEENGRGIYVVTNVESPSAVQADVYLGKWVSLHTTAAGKAILASLPRERVESIVAAHGLPAETEHTITDRDRLYEELDTVADQGYACNRSERINKQWAVGVPIVGPTGELIGGLSVSGPEHRMNGDRIADDLSGALLGVADELELNIAHM